MDTFINSEKYDEAHIRVIKYKDGVVILTQEDQEIVIEPDQINKLIIAMLSEENDV